MQNFAVFVESSDDTDVNEWFWFWIEKKIYVSIIKKFAKLLPSILRKGGIINSFYLPESKAIDLGGATGWNTTGNIDPGNWLST